MHLVPAEIVAVIASALTLLLTRIIDHYLPACPAGKEAEESING